MLWIGIVAVEMSANEGRLKRRMTALYTNSSMFWAKVAGQQ